MEVLNTCTNEDSVASGWANDLPRELLFRLLLALGRHDDREIAKAAVGINKCSKHARG